MTQSAQYSNAKKSKRTLLILLCIFLAAGCIFAAIWFATSDHRRYRQGTKLLSSGDYAGAAAVFEALADFKDAPQQLQSAQYAIADALLMQGDFHAAVEAFEALGDLQDAPQRLQEAQYAIAVELMNNGQLLAAAESFAKIGDYQKSAEFMGKCYYSLATTERLAKNYEQARTYFALAGDYSDSALQEQRTIYAMGHDAFLSGDYDAADAYFAQLDGEESDYGNPHFLTIDDAAPYLRQQMESLADQIHFCVGEKPDPGCMGKRYSRSSNRG